MARGHEFDVGLGIGLSSTQAAQYLMSKGVRPADIREFLLSTGIELECVRQAISRAQKLRRRKYQGRLIVKLAATC